MKKILLFSFFLLLHSVFAGNLHITIFNVNRFAVYPQYPLSEYGITEHRYFSVVPEFVQDLKISKLLYIGQTFNPDAIFEKPEFANAVKEFLQNGGTVWFESYTFGRPATTKWLKENGINLPAQDTSNQAIIVGVPASDVDHPVLKIPYEIPENYGCKGHFCWRNWDKDFIAPFRLRGDPSGATMLIKENVFGKGKIIFNCMWALSTTDYAGNGFWGTGQKFLTNILSYCYGQKISAENIVPLFEKFQTNKPLAMWTKNPYFPLADCPADAPDRWKLENLSFKACVNEDVSALFCLTAGKQNSFEISIQKNDLKSQDSVIPASKIAIYELQFFKDFSGRWIYDPMPEIEKIVVPQGETRQIWVSINTFGVKPGIYKGEIKLAYDRKEEKIPVNLTVWPVNLPEKNPMFFCVWDYVPNEGRTNLIGGWENWKNYQEDLLSHGVNVFPVMSFNHPTVKCDKEGNIIEPLNYKLFDQEFYIREKGYIYLISTPRVYGAPSHIKYPSKEYDTMLRQWLKEIIAHIKSLGLDYDQFAFYPWDELSSSSDIPNAVNEYKIIKEVDPNAKIFLTVGGSGMARFDRLAPVMPYIDIWCPHIFFYRYFITDEASRRAVIEKMKSTGGQVWSYENTGRWKVKDENYVYFRLKPVGAYRAGVKGYGFWAYNVWKGNPWEVFDEKGNVKQGAGTEGLAIVYSGPKPVTTPRWEGLREGMNDVKYFEVLRQEIEKSREKKISEAIIAEAENTINIALKEITEKIENQELPVKWREKIVEMILKLRQLQKSEPSKQ
ncbi:MAG: DUF4091 domain-containing protein [Candidatus Omnitrophica bacterium]|nr:DUF4091 domain-containing protein [Candidatus Omnitrophota bacterium]MCM8828397.1 DUF4091 domain-containing protein [Candidatus Omnitrophota bacterium]